MHAKFEGENLKIERAVSILVKWVSIMWSNLKLTEKFIVYFLFTFFKCWRFISLNLVFTVVDSFAADNFKKYKGNKRRKIISCKLTVDAIEVLIKYCNNSFPGIDQFIR